MKNMEISVKNNILTVTVDLTKTMGISATGKSEVIASSYGNIKIAPDRKEVLGFNLYLPIPKEDRAPKDR